VNQKVIIVFVSESFCGHLLYLDHLITFRLVPR